MGAGGAIFVAGGTLKLMGPLTISGNEVAAGAGASGSTAASAFGTGLFLVGNDSNNSGSGSLLTVSPGTGQTQTISDVIADQTGSGGVGVWGLTLNGSGSLILSGANTFSGGVTVINGYLGVNNTSGSGTGSGAVSVASGAAIGGSGKIGSNLTVQAGSSFAPGSGIGTLSIGGNFTWNGSAQALYSLGGNGSSSSALSITGSLTKSGTGVYQFNFQNSGSAGVTYTLATFSATNFSSTDFTYTGLAPNLTGIFSVSNSQLQFSAVSTAPAITSGNSVSSVAGSPFSYTITATNAPTSFSIAGGSLPAGLSLSSSTGVISGTPTQAGSYSASVGATNGSGTGTAVLTIIIQPAPAITSGGTASGTQGSSFIYSITATNSPTSYSVVGGILPTGLTLNGATGAIAGTPTQAGAFVVTVGATNTAGTGTATLTFTIAPAISIGQQPLNTTITYGGAATIAVTATSAQPLSYQWFLNGVSIPGATSSVYTATAAGSYTVSITTSSETTVSAPATVALANRVLNISSRAMVGNGGAISIAGFSISSYSGAPKQVLIRGIGPGLTAFGLGSVLALPILSVYDVNGVMIATNSGWGNSTVISSTDTAVGAFALQPNSADAAVVLSLAPGNYTAELSGANGTDGVGLIEVYEVSADSGHIVNLSTRANVGTGPNILIAGIVIGGIQPSQVLIRAIGPGLTQFGVSGILSSPALSVYDSTGKLLAINAGWSSGSSADAVNLAAAATVTGAFPLQPGSSDCALLLTLPPGSYSAEVNGANNSTGIALLECYQVP